MLGNPPAGCAVVLPGGLLYGERCLTEAELRPLTGREEAWLAEHPHASSAEAVTNLLAACLLRIDDQPSTIGTVRSLLVADRDYLVLQLRRLTLGERLSATLDCPSCGAWMDVDVDATAIPVERRPQTAQVYSLALTADDGTGRTARFRLPNGADQEEVARQAPETAIDTLFARCMVDDGGAALTQRERDTIAKAMEELAPDVELQLDLICPECGETFEMPFDVTSFFFAELRAQQSQLLREIHHLAFHYHWSEADILGLPRSRRRAYLSLLSEALRRD